MVLGLALGGLRLAAGLAQGLGRVLQLHVVEGRAGQLGVRRRVGVGRVAAPAAALGVGAAERGADALERLGELGRDDPQLVGVAAGELRQDLEVLVGEELLVGLAAVDGVEDLGDGAGLTCR